MEFLESVNVNTKTLDRNYRLFATHIQVLEHNIVAQFFKKLHHYHELEVYIITSLIISLNVTNHGL